MTRRKSIMPPNSSQSASDEFDIEKSGVGKHAKSEDHGVVAAAADDQLVAGSAYEQKLVRKLDLHIVPVAMLLYLFSFLDR